MSESSHYAIGTPGHPWAEEEKAKWLAAQRVQRSYREEVSEKLLNPGDAFEIGQYGELAYRDGSYPLVAARSRQWSANRASVLVTGGVHGYETSGVQGAIRFLQTKARDYRDLFNFVVAPCVSPWGYETINRWNPDAIDPNRSFYPGSPAPECALLMTYLSSLDTEFVAHIDLHETTDTDNSEFMPALAARDATPLEVWDIPDGFYLVGDAENPAPEFQSAIIESVERVTHIAPPDGDGRIIGLPLAQHGVINYRSAALGLCAGATTASYSTTTEVYPDSPKVDDENCIDAQVAALVGALDFLKRQGLAG
jgi:hypothetical protein